jgi:hypothetical protein
MHKAIFVMMSIFAFIICNGLSQVARADGVPIIRQTKKVRPACQGPKCGPYAPCEAGCRVVCPDISSCYSLKLHRGQYGPYNPRRSVAYWGRFTPSGWGVGYWGRFPRPGWIYWW